MSPFEQAALLYQSLDAPLSFGQVVEAHALHGGTVIMRPDLFLVARPILSEWDEASILDPEIVAENPDCWHVFMAAGSARKAILEAVPFWLPLISFHRRGRFVICPADKLFDKIRA